MNITIKISKAELQGIMDYLYELEGRRATKDEIKQFISGIVSTTLSSPREAVSDYIAKYQNQ